MYILGVHLDPPFVRTALLYKKGKKIEVRLLETALSPNQQMIHPENRSDFQGPLSNLNVKPQYTHPENRSDFQGPLSNLNVKPLYIKNFKGRVAAGISTKDLLIRSVELKIANRRHIEEAITFQTEATSYFNPTDVLTIPLLQAKEKERTRALLFTASRKAIQQQLLALEQGNLDPDALSAVPRALCYFLNWKFPEILDAIIVDIGSSEISCIYMEGGELKKAHSISGGAELLLEALLQDRRKVLLKKEIESAAKQIDLLLLKPNLNPHLTENLNALRQEVRKVLYSFSRDEKKKVIFTGRTDSFIHLPEFLAEEVFSLPAEEELKFATSIGLAIEQTTPSSLNFRQKEFFPRKNWKRMGMYALSLFFSSLFLSIGCVIFGLKSSHLRKVEMLQSLHLPDEGPLEQKLDEWISSIEKNNRDYPYILQAPKVAEVLAWLSAHPILEELKEQNDAIEIQEMQYQLVNFPKIGANKNPYLAKVTLEFKLKNVTHARKFHEALRTGDHLVNPNLEITWEVLNDSYQTSFYLKNRGSYGA
jgi:hypothetical protein